VQVSAGLEGGSLLRHPLAQAFAASVPERTLPQLSNQSNVKSAFFTDDEKRFYTVWVISGPPLRAPRTSARGGLCCKSRFAGGVKNSEGRWRVLRVMI
jgi:hypothetical protein